MPNFIEGGGVVVHNWHDCVGKRQKKRKMARGYRIFNELSCEIVNDKRCKEPVI